MRILHLTNFKLVFLNIIFFTFRLKDDIIILQTGRAKITSVNRQGEQSE